MDGTPAPPRPAAVRWGLATAIVLACIYWIGMLWNPVFNLPISLLFLAAAWGIHKGRKWSGYGPAMVLGIAMAGAFLRVRSANPSPGWPVVGAAMAFFGVAAFLMFRAGRALSAARDSGIAWMVAATAAAVFFLAFEPFVNPSASMENTLLIGDNFLVRTVGVSSPTRGDLVAFRYPPDPKQTFIKRVVAVGGDRVRLQDKRLIVNGVPQTEPFVVHATQYVDDFRDNFPRELASLFPNSQWTTILHDSAATGDVLVPPGKYFVLGDNRDYSLDSRYWGFVDRQEIIGKPVLIYFSAQRAPTALDNQMPTPILLHPGDIRWNRILRVL